MDVLGSVLDILTEDSRGAIKNNLKLHPDIAEEFHRRSAKHSFALARMWFLYFREDTGDKNMSAERTLANLNRDPEYWADTGIKGFLDTDRASAAGILDFFNEVPQAAKLAKSKTWLEIKEKLRLWRVKNVAKVEGERKKFMEMDGGMYWTDIGVQCNAYEKEMMGHCAKDGRGRLMSLRDKKHMPHVTMTWRREDNSVLQIKGKENKIPIEKYHPFIIEFFRKTEATLNDDEFERLLPELTKTLRGLASKKVRRYEDEFGIRYKVNGKLHRTNGPAYIGKGSKEGFVEYFLHGYRHRVGGPAIIGKYRRQWYVNGQLHRIGGPAAIEYDENGNVENTTWSQNGKRHRIGGPAFEWERANQYLWYQNGQLHREDGPAYDYQSNKFYFLRGERMGKEEWEKKVRALEESVLDSVLDILSEDSRGAIKNNLKLPPELAEKLHGIDPKYAFSLARVFLLHLETLDSGWRREHIPRLLEWVDMWMDPHATGHHGEGAFSGWDGMGKIVLDIIRANPHLAKKFKTMEFEEIKEVVTKKQLELRAKEEGRRKKFMEMDGGMYWTNLGSTCNEFERIAMGHCAHDGRGDLFSLRDKKHMPHVTMTWDKKGNKIHQIKGKGNKIPIEKYHPYIIEFFRKTKADLWDAMLDDSSLGLKINQLVPTKTTRSVDEHDVITYTLRGILHRTNGPARVTPNGTKEYYLNGRLHRSGGPAYISATKRMWAKNGELHRTNGPARIIYSKTGEIESKTWYIDGYEHREDGPAHIDKRPESAHHIYYLNGLAHRVDGPAYVSPHRVAYYLEGQRWDKETWEKRVKSGITEERGGGLDAVLSILTEDSRGSIKNVLKFKPWLADVFHNISPKFSFSLAHTVWAYWREMDGGNEEKTLSNLNDRSFNHEERSRKLLTTGVLSDILPMFELNPQTAKRAKKMAFREIEQMVKDERARSLAGGEAKREKLLKLSDGMYWTDIGVQCNEYEKEMMGHCASDGRGNLISLRDKKHRSHVTMTWNKEQNIVLQIKGKGNKIPIEKYHPYIIEFFRKMKPEIKDSEVEHEYPDFYKTLMETLPAVVKKAVDPNGTIRYTLRGKPHRTNGPAYMTNDGKWKKWYRHGELHRSSGPAVVTPARRDWYIDGKRHRVGGPATILYDMDGDVRTRSWYQNGKRHRVGGPASFTTYNGTVTKVWYQNGLLHNEEGPAYFADDGSGHRPVVYYYLHNERMGKREWERVLQKKRETTEVDDETLNAVLDILGEDTRGADPRIVRMIEALPPGVNIAIKERGNDHIVSYVGSGEVKGHVAMRHAPTEMDQGSFTIGGDCSDAFVVYASKVAPRGFGPLLYEVALEYASKHGGGLTSDRGVVSDYARNVWNTYAMRDDVDDEQLDIEKQQADEEFLSQLTPNDESDDCLQNAALRTHGKNWDRSPLSRIYIKGGTPIIDHLKSIKRMG